MGKRTEAKAKNDKRWKREFSDKIKAILKEKKMSNAELSHRTKIDQSLMSHYVHGYYVPNVRNAIKIALALEVDFEELFGFMDYAAWPAYLD